VAVPPVAARDGAIKATTRLVLEGPTVKLVSDTKNEKTVTTVK
jgi:hypothetical protein